MNLKVSVLGAGSFGTTMAHVISRNAPTLLWCRRADMAEEINREHRNSTYLPDAPLAESLRATGDLEEAVLAAIDRVVVGGGGGAQVRAVGRAGAFLGVKKCDCLRGFRPELWAAFGDS